MNSKLRKGIRRALIVAAIGIVSISHSAYAQSNDMFAGLALKQKLFTPHANTCTASESFIAIAGGATGFCIENTERTGATWAEAKNTCASIKARLPEPAEFTYACNHAPAALIGMTGNYEWSGNYATVYLSIATSFASGNSSCDDLNAGQVGGTVITFRCVE